MNGKPPWLKVRMGAGQKERRVRAYLRNHLLHTVCEEAHCPNKAHCWSRGTATFMILGNICTRNCGFCNVKTGQPEAVDAGEPRRVAEAVEQFRIKHAVITSVTRDDLADGGAGVFAETVRQIKALRPETTVEVLIPDLMGNVEALKMIIDARPEIINHNLETVPRLTPLVRPQANYFRSLSILRQIKKNGSSVIFSKSGLMLGLGETETEVITVLEDLRKVECDILTLGQYLQPTKSHLPVAQYVHPDQFQRLGEVAREMGFLYVASAPLVRSSFHADNFWQHLLPREKTCE